MKYFIKKRKNIFNFNKEFLSLLLFLLLYKKIFYILILNFNIIKNFIKFKFYNLNNIYFLILILVVFLFNIIIIYQIFFNN